MTDMSFAPGAWSKSSTQAAFNGAVHQIDESKGNPPPYSMRFTWEERERLKRDSGKASWAAYIRECVFGDKVSKRRKSQNTTADMQAIARLGALLGQSRIPNNLNQLAKSANTGCLVMDDETRQQLGEACAHVAHIRQILMIALSVSERS